jgi:hypothetical protein
MAIPATAKSSTLDATSMPTIHAWKLMHFVVRSGQSDESQPALIGVHLNLTGKVAAKN